MKNLLLSTVILLSAAFIIAIIPTEAEADIYEDTIRLHILANSDKDEDQDLKIKIRDMLLEKYGEHLKKSVSIDEALCNTGALLEEMERDIAKWIGYFGYEYSVKVTLTEEWYDTREYEEFTLPKGIYTSLRVIIGKGDGQNWWCVMYPPLCLELACENAPSDDGVINYTNEEIKLIKSGKYNIKFKILELLSDAFTKNG